MKLSEEHDQQMDFDCDYDITSMCAYKNVSIYCSLLTYVILNIE